MEADAWVEAEWAAFCLRCHERLMATTEQKLAEFRSLTVPEYVAASLGARAVVRESRSGRRHPVGTRG